MCNENMNSHILFGLWRRAKRWCLLCWFLKHKKTTLKLWFSFRNMNIIWTYNLTDDKQNSWTWTDIPRWKNTDMKNSITYYLFINYCKKSAIEFHLICSCNFGIASKNKYSHCKTSEENIIWHFLFIYIHTIGKFFINVLVGQFYIT